MGLRAEPMSIRRRNKRHRSPPEYRPEPKPRALVEPPRPPLELTPLIACSPETDPEVLWHIARESPSLRKWLVANPAASPAMLEYIGQVGGLGVGEALCILLDSLDGRADSAISL